MTYYDVYCNLYEDSNRIYFCDDSILELLGIEVDSVSYDDYNRLISLLDKSIENGFNEGFKFAMKIFSDNL